MNTNNGGLILLAFIGTFSASLVFQAAAFYWILTLSSFSALVTEQVAHQVAEKLLVANKVTEYFETASITKTKIAPKDQISESCVISDTTESTDLCPLNQKTKNSENSKIVDSKTSGAAKSPADIKTDIKTDIKSSGYLKSSSPSKISDDSISTVPSRSPRHGLPVVLPRKKVINNEPDQNQTTHQGTNQALSGEPVAVEYFNEFDSAAADQKAAQELATVKVEQFVEPTEPFDDSAGPLDGAESETVEMNNRLIKKLGQTKNTRNRADEIERAADPTTMRPEPFNFSTEIERADW